MLRIELAGKSMLCYPPRMSTALAGAQPRAEKREEKREVDKKNGIVTKMFFSNLELKELMDTVKMFVIILEDFLLVKEDLETHRKCTFVVIFSYLLLSEKKYPNNNCYSNVFIIGGCHVILRISVFLSLTNTVQCTLYRI